MSLELGKNKCFLAFVGKKKVVPGEVAYTLESCTTLLHFH